MADGITNNCKCKPCVLRAAGESIEKTYCKAQDKVVAGYDATVNGVKTGYNSTASIFNSLDTTSKIASVGAVAGGIVSVASFGTILSNLVKNPTAQKVLKYTGFAGAAVFAAGLLTTGIMALVNKKAAAAPAQTAAPEQKTDAAPAPVVAPENKAEKQADKAEKQADKAEKQADKANKQADKAEQSKTAPAPAPVVAPENKAEKQADKAEQSRTAPEQKTDAAPAPVVAPENKAEKQADKAKKQEEQPIVDAKAAEEALDRALVIQNSENIDKVSSEIRQLEANLATGKQNETTLKAKIVELEGKIAANKAKIAELNSKKLTGNDAKIDETLVLVQNMKNDKEIDDSYGLLEKIDYIRTAPMRALTGADAYASLSPEMIEQQKANTKHLTKNQQLDMSINSKNEAIKKLQAKQEALNAQLAEQVQKNIAMNEFLAKANHHLDMLSKLKINSAEKDAVIKMGQGPLDIFSDYIQHDNILHPKKEIFNFIPVYPVGHAN